jgi:hypothetical protein
LVELVELTHSVLFKVALVDIWAGFYSYFAFSWAASFFSLSF